eukprot:TRINITY_DN5445_c0_g1_i1.p1 TRINITY_DN5445_c0_g1~~TRINITY_DN5445_c0_g1_i1.p1  ORF type:complete len:581 (+),score=162.40 TRINITY_DN5445_c0_g1_i1:136-1878(+)
MGEGTQAVDWNGVEDVEEPKEQEKKMWGRLISLNPEFANVELREKATMFGRNPSSDVRIADLNISGRHARITREESGTTQGGNLVIAFIEDFSTNGTFLDGEKIGHGNKRLLSSGGEITLLKKGAKKIAFIYQEVQVQKDDECSCKYEMREVLGTGNFAVVKLAIERSTGNRFAVKMIDKKRFAAQATSHKDKIKDEFFILKQLNHDHIIKVIDSFETDKTLNFVLELVTGGDLFGFIQDTGPLPEVLARKLFGQTVSAIAYLHENDIAHRDLKPDNLLLKDHNHDCIKVSDFGFSRKFDEGSYMKTLCGTPQYLAPEVISGDGTTGYSKAVDIWSLGCILYCMLASEPPFTSDKKEGIYDQITNGHYNFDAPVWKRVSPSVLDLVRRLLTVTPQHRLTAKQIPDHPWMKGEATVNEAYTVEHDFSALGKRNFSDITSPDDTTAFVPALKKKKTEPLADVQQSQQPASPASAEASAVAVTPPARPATPPHEPLQQMGSPLSSPTVPRRSSGGGSTSGGDSPVAAAASASSPADASSTSPTSGTHNGRPLCKYGARCYRKNPQHLADFAHPWREAHQQHQQ